MTTAEERISRLEGAYEQVDRRLDSMDRRLDSIDTRLSEMNQSIDSRFSEMNSRLNTLLTVTIGLWATLVVGIIAGLITLFTTR